MLPLPGDAAGATAVPITARESPTHAVTTLQGWVAQQDLGQPGSAQLGSFVVPLIPALRTPSSRPATRLPPSPQRIRPIHAHPPTHTAGSPPVLQHHAHHRGAPRAAHHLPVLRRRRGRAGKRLPQAFPRGGAREASGASGQCCRAAQIGHRPGAALVAGGQRAVRGGAQRARHVPRRQLRRFLPPLAVPVVHSNHSAAAAGRRLHRLHQERILVLRLGPAAQRPHGRGHRHASAVRRAASPRQRRVGGGRGRVVGGPRGLYRGARRAQQPLPGSAGCGVGRQGQRQGQRPAAEENRGWGSLAARFPAPQRRPWGRVGLQSLQLGR